MRAGQSEHQGALGGKIPAIFFVLFCFLFHGLCPTALISCNRRAAGASLWSPHPNGFGLMKSPAWSAEFVQDGFNIKNTRGGGGGEELAATPSSIIVNGFNNIHPVNPAPVGSAPRNVNTSVPEKTLYCKMRPACCPASPI